MPFQPVIKENQSKKSPRLQPWNSRYETLTKTYNKTKTSSEGLLLERTPITRGGRKKRSPSTLAGITMGKMSVSRIKITKSTLLLNIALDVEIWEYLRLDGMSR